MKPISLIAMTALALASAATVAQTYGPAQGQAQTPADIQSQTQVTPSTTTQTPMAPSSSSATQTPSTTSSTAAAGTPAPVMTESKVDLTSEPGPPADMRAAREEAVNALHWAKTEGCRTDSAPRDCVRRAQEDYSATMARLGSGSRMSDTGTMSGSGTSAAGRTDRN